jgi:hypothetical protein
MSVFSCIFSITFTKFMVDMSISSWRTLDAFVHHNFTGIPSAATTFRAVFFPFISLDFKPKYYDLVYSTVNKIHADELTQLSCITAVTTQDSLLMGALSNFMYSPLQKRVLALAPQPGRLTMQMVNYGGQVYGRPQVIGFVYIVVYFLFFQMKVHHSQHLH